MHFEIADGVPLFVPAVTPSTETLSTCSYIYILYYIELLFILIMCPAAVWLIYVLQKLERVFHINLIRVIQEVTNSEIYTGLAHFWLRALQSNRTQNKAHLVAFTVTQASRVFLMLYDLEVIGTKGSVDIKLFVLNFVRYMPLSWLQTMIPAIAAERTFASRYISDYERQNRSWISYTVIGSALMVAVLLQVLVQLVSISERFMYPLAALSLSITIFSSVAMTVVHRRDAAKLRDLESMTGYSTINYTLSMKFQLAENVRVTQWLTYSSFGYAIWAIIGAFFAFPPLLLFNESEFIGQFLYEVLNVYFALTFAMVIWLSLAASGKLRRFSDTLLPPCCNRRISNALYLNAIPIKSNDTLIATELYFKQLRSTWEP